MALLLPTQLAFGFASALINSYVSPKITAVLVGNAAIGYYGGLVAIVAGVVSLLGGQLAKCMGGKKWPLMLSGSLANIHKYMQTDR